MDKKIITYFSKDWLKDPDFEDWIASASNNAEARCRICCKNFKLCNMEGKLCCVMQMVKSINYMLIESRCFSNQKK